MQQPYARGPAGLVGGTACFVPGVPGMSSTAPLTQAAAVHDAVDESERQLTGHASCCHQLMTSGPLKLFALCLCAGALVISTPVASVAGLTRAAKKVGTCGDLPRACLCDMWSLMHACVMAKAWHITVTDCCITVKDCLDL